MSSFWTKAVAGFAAAMAGIGTAPGIGTAVAAPLGQPRNWQLGLQDSGTSIMDSVRDFHTLLLVVIIGITLLVLALLIYVMVRFRANRNPVPSKTSHNTLVEVAWTVLPVLILVVITVPSFKLLYYQDQIPEADITIKAIGNQWYWTYEYPDHGNFVFDALMVPDAELQPDQPRLLATDNNLVVPVGTTVRLLITANDVLHAWTVPAFGVKTDAVPGRINQLWFRVDKEGMYYGQCSELCGALHGFMPIAVEAVSDEAFATWVADARQRFASKDTPDLRLARAQAE